MTTSCISADESAVLTGIFSSTGKSLRAIAIVPDSIRRNTMARNVQFDNYGQ